MKFSSLHMIILHGNDSEKYKSIIIRYNFGGFIQYIGILKTATFRKLVLLPSAGDRSIKTSSLSARGPQQIGLLSPVI
jgi:hypothetical protein